MTSDLIITAGFSDDHHADRAIELIAKAGITARYARRCLVRLKGKAQLVILEATLADSRQAARAATCVHLAHGVPIRAPFTLDQLAAPG